MNSQLTLPTYRWTFLVAALLGSHIILAEERSPGLPPVGWPDSTNAPLKQIGPGLFEIGKVRLDKERKTISFPAVLNMNEALIEYLVVTSFGKVHESLLRTDVEPWHVHVAMLLLGAQGAGTNSFPEDHTQPLPGDKISIEVSWKSKGKEKRHRAEELVYDRTRKAAMRKGQWIYTGSKVIEGIFIAQRDGSVISLIEDEEALVNNPWPGRDNDDNWEVKAANLPPLESTVQVTITLEPSKAARP